LDPRHLALTGAEMRACWTPPDASLEDHDAPRRLPVGVTPAEPGVRVPRTFVPVDEVVVATPPPRASTAPSSPTSVTSAPVDGGAWSLWGDPER
jgi:hypothetical protein